MKSRDFFRAENDSIYFLQSGKAYALHDLIRTEVLIRPVLKTAGASIANAMANAMTNSLVNGNEQVHIIVRIHLSKGYGDILMNQQVLIRGNLDYHEMVEHARKLQKKAEAVHSISIYETTSEY